VIDVRVLRQDPDGARTSLLRRMDPALGASVDQVLDLDRRWRALVTESEALRAERNAQTEEVARKKRAREPADDLLAQLKASADRARALDAEARELEEQLRDLLVRLPNFPHRDSPSGSAEANRVVRGWGESPRFDFTPRPHWELGESLGILDLARGSKISGSGFPVFRGAGARLVRALASFMLDLHTTEHGYLEIAPPYLVSRAALTGTGQLPKFEDDLYASSRDDLFLIPTAEVPVTNLHRDEILEAAALPISYVAFTPCFRREAGAAGKDTRGLLRVHQFDKVELVRLAAPDASDPARRDGAPATGAALPGGGAGQRGHRIQRGTHLRSRSVGRGRGNLAGVLQCQHLHRFPGPARQYPLPSRSGSQAGVRPHLERFRRRLRPDHRGHPGEQSGRRRIGRHSRGPPALHGSGPASAQLT
jgi:seryl-tRNA synthetase